MPIMLGIAGYLFWLIVNMFRGYRAISDAAALGLMSAYGVFAFFAYLWFLATPA